MKPFISVLLVLPLVFLLMVPAFAADRTTKEYWIEFFKSGKEVTVEVARSLTYEENLARMDAMAEINAQNRKPVATSTDDATIIANIKKYGVELEIGDNGFYDNGAKITPHLTAIQSGLSYLGTGFTKKISKTYENTPDAKARAESNTKYGKFVLHLIPQNDVVGKAQTARGAYNYGDGSIYFWGFNSSVVTARMTIHEYGHALEEAAHGGKSAAPAPFSTEKYTGLGGSADTASTHPDRFVSKYAERDIAEDYAECFRIAIENGADKPYTGSKDTVVYKKMKTVYDDLQSFVGADSRATQRVGGYLGLMP